MRSRGSVRCVTLLFHQLCNGSQCQLLNAGEFKHDSRNNIWQMRRNERIHILSLVSIRMAAQLLQSFAHGITSRFPVSSQKRKIWNVFMSATWSPSIFRIPLLRTPEVNMKIAALRSFRHICRSGPSVFHQ